MPLVTAQNLIEMDDFTGGWAPGDLDGSTVGLTDAGDPTTLPSLSNIIIDPGTGALRTRAGFDQYVIDIDTTGDHYIKQMMVYGAPQGPDIVFILTDESSDPDNVQIWAYDIEGETSSRVDTPGVTWANPTSMHWTVVVDAKVYGGSRGNPMWSWNPNDGYDGDAGSGTFKTWVEDIDGAVDTATEYGKNYAWKGTEKVYYTDTDSYYKPDKDIRYDRWDVDYTYARGDRVTRSHDGYAHSYRCIKDHDADASVTRPGDGSSFRTYWKHVILGPPVDDDGDTAGSWTLAPGPAESPIGAWFADRLFLRFDGQGDNSRLQYSAPVKLQKGRDIANTEWDPTDWTPGNDIRGQGGGWLPFNDGKRKGVITALRPFGQYLLVFKRQYLYVLSGQDDTSWTVRAISTEHGAIGSYCTVELDGLVYFLDDEGLFVTDGTAEKAVPGNERVERWFRDRMQRIVEQMHIDGREPTLFTYRGLVGITMPDFSEEGADSAQGVNCTVFYDPVTQSFWPTTLPVLFLAHRLADDHRTKRVFATSELRQTAFEFDPHPDVDSVELSTDDEVDIPWYLSTAWLPFGKLREQRRVRRVWAVVQGALEYELTQYGDWDDSAAQNTNNRTVAGTDAVHIEGGVMADPHAIRLGLSGDESPARVYGFAVDTQPRRRRYHS